MKSIELREEHVSGEFCQHCKSHANRPGTCTKHNQFRARKSYPCIDFKSKRRS